MKIEYDVTIVGEGLAGSTTAKNLAEKGFNDPWRKDIDMVFTPYFSYLDLVRWLKSLFYTFLLSIHKYLFQCHGKYYYMTWIIMS
jgi:hypothetical protein